ncbi:MAG: hypothetical protein JWP78_3099 [Mucilaginibacter sp.]|nr:hypothetical protein [Mucilaginibacter sp.]
MIGKIIKSRHFERCVRYCLGKDQAFILDARGIRTSSLQRIIHDFNMQRKLNMRLGVAAGHIALSWSPRDRGRITPSVMTQRAREYMDKMGIRDTQYLLVEHRDRPHPHLHLIYNRVNRRGKTISDKFQRLHSGRVCTELKLKYGYMVSPGKAGVNRAGLRGKDKVRYQLFDAICPALESARSWQELEAALSGKDIQFRFRYQEQTGEIQGVSFAAGKIKFKGSAIDSSLSFGRIEQQLSRNLVRSIAAGQHPGSTAGIPAEAPPRASDLYRPEKNDAQQNEQNRSVESTRGLVRQDPPEENFMQQKGRGR